ncbi:MAG: N5-glutamine methyltransferase family protein [Solirubrobacteraceae bacterium]
MCALDEHPALVKRLEAGGFIAPADEAEALTDVAAGDATRLEELVRRRLTGEPLAWITGSVTFCGTDIRVEPGVYVPRWHTEALALRAAEHCPAGGIAIDLCTGTGAIAATISRLRPAARVVGTDLDERAVACARGNGVEAYSGDLFAAVPPDLEGRVDVLVAVVPYVPERELQYLQRDTLTFETPLAYLGGADGTDVLRRVMAGAPLWLRPGGALLLELGGEQAQLLRCDLIRYRYTAVTDLHDEEGAIRGVEARRSGLSVTT